VDEVFRSRVGHIRRSRRRRGRRGGRRERERRGRRRERERIRGDTHRAVRRTTRRRRSDRRRKNKQIRLT